MEFFLFSVEFSPSLKMKNGWTLLCFFDLSFFSLYFAAPLCVSSTPEEKVSNLIHLCFIYCSSYDRIIICCLWLSDELIHFCLLLMRSLLNLRFAVPHLVNCVAPGRNARLKVADDTLHYSYTSVDVFSPFFYFRFLFFIFFWLRDFLFLLFFNFCVMKNKYVKIFKLFLHLIFC